MLLGNGTGNISVVSGWGTDNQVLTSQGGTLIPDWETLTVSLAGDNDWTGINGFGTSTPAVSPVGIQGNLMVSGTTTTGNLLLASSTLANSNGTNIQFPSGLGTISSVLSFARNGAVDLSESSAATTTLVTVLLPANTLKTHSILKVDALYSASGGSVQCYTEVDIGTGYVDNPNGDDDEGGVIGNDNIFSGRFRIDFRR